MPISQGQLSYIIIWWVRTIFMAKQNCLHLGTMSWINSSVNLVTSLPICISIWLQQFSQTPEHNDSRTRIISPWWMSRNVTYYANHWTLWSCVTWPICYWSPCAGSANCCQIISKSNGPCVIPSAQYTSYCCKSSPHQGSFRVWA